MATSWTLRKPPFRGQCPPYADYYYFLAPLGRKAGAVATQLFLLVLRSFSLPDPLLVVIDDTPTKRYGPHVEGADLHRSPTPGPAHHRYLYRDLWVTLSLASRHPLWGPLANNRSATSGRTGRCTL